eukprot:CAMPEP_0196782018 /NCGR_PEP_ID=MMETSP1104-20130614/10536_1 /TAXON_ID=33652 /ORGANISM="Cafeteria sp., Strain Caron Lab Isolate" /LENGTH=130 /DNA_ID=CAMNT_0042152249 /DNA_START=22 /DNA_END=417 /DNA_ORIENTATION=+
MEEEKAAHTIKLYLPTYKLEPDDETRVRPSQIQAICKSVMEETLRGQKYDEDNCREWSLEISESIKSRVKALNIPRYKVVVQVTIGEMKHQGVMISSKCLWDPNTDNYSSETFKNQSLWCTAMVFGCYTQ